MNFVTGRVEGPGLVAAEGLGRAVPLAVRLPSEGSEVTLGLRPQHLAVAEGSTHRVELTEALGGVSYIHVTAPTGEKLVVESRDDPRVAPGDRVGIAFDPAQVFAFDPVSGARLR
ncbi:TOBE domain-containing protein, partial [Rubellimicrobium sp. CFH 75288]|uniref:TOBE domain-containing protein n=1 Tax=Rubellimicrobium sp. CFH 75288 TaxID=2697034 RepID=UPI0014125A5D